MNRYCKCSGRIINYGYKQNVVTGRRIALFQCHKCSKYYTQRLRADKCTLELEAQIPETDSQAFVTFYN